jgi:proline racemase/trans-L-3-hydroxyproline dehydratase
MGKYMKGSRHILAVDSHTMGEPTRVVIHGVGEVSGSTMAEKRRFMAENLDYIRTALMHEPRGHCNMFGAIITEPTKSEADLGIIFMDCGGYLTMCGHGAVGAVTVALEMGILNVEEPLTHVVLDTPAGLVRTRAEIKNEGVTNVTVQNVPAFLCQEAFPLDVPVIGTVPIDIAFGGNFYALVETNELHLELLPENVSKLVDTGMSILEKVRGAVKVIHPTESHANSIDLVEICDPFQGGEHHSKNIVVFGQGQFDRSPCGTGTCARMAALFHKGKLGLEQDFVSESIIGTLFRGRLVSETMVGNIKAVVPEITARAFITGIHQCILDPADPLKYGFLV